jgi:hypothetical protein
VSTWGHVFLGVIALATLSTAIVQIALLLAAAKLARRLEKLTDSVEAQLQPVFAHLDTIGREAARATSLASQQVERVDLLFADVNDRLGETMDTLQSALAVPIREGGALLAGVRAMFGTLKAPRPSSRSRADDEDALFI